MNVIYEADLKNLQLMLSEKEQNLQTVEIDMHEQYETLLSEYQVEADIKKQHANRWAEAEHRYQELVKLNEEVVSKKNDEIKLLELNISEARETSKRFKSALEIKEKDIDELTKIITELRMKSVVMAQDNQKLRDEVESICEDYERAILELQAKIAEHGIVTSKIENSPSTSAWIDGGISNSRLTRRMSGEILPGLDEFEAEEDTPESVQEVEKYQPYPEIRYSTFGQPLGIIRDEDIEENEENEDEEYNEEKIVEDSQSREVTRKRTNTSIGKLLINSFVEKTSSEKNLPKEISKKAVSNLQTPSTSKVDEKAVYLLNARARKTTLLTSPIKPKLSDNSSKQRNIMKTLLKLKGDDTVVDKLNDETLDLALSYEKTIRKLRIDIDCYREEKEQLNRLVEAREWNLGVVKLDLAQKTFKIDELVQKLIKIRHEHAQEAHILTTELKKVRKDESKLIKVINKAKKKIKGTTDSHDINPDDLL